MSEQNWIIAFKDVKFPTTASESEQGAWNLLLKELPDLKKFSQRDLKSFGYSAKKAKKK